MNIWTADKVLNRMNEMLEKAINGEPVEGQFDETKMAAIESKLSKYLAMNQLDKRQLEDEKNRINQLISDISHQTKTPISNLLLYSELLQEKDLSEDDRELVNSLHNQTEKLSFLISSMVKLSRLENGIIQTEPEKNHVAELLSRIGTQAAEKARLKNISLNIDAGNYEAAFDLKWTAEAVFNIVDNAIKYTPENGSVCIKASDTPMFIRIDVEDTGIGIAEEEYPKIFGRFYKSENTMSEDGVGLGLYLARYIISSEGGYIKVSSIPGKGSVFSVFLPKAVENTSK